MQRSTLAEQARSAPSEPGVYQFHDGETVLYVGKAVDIRSRVRSYTDPRSNRIRRMVRQADRIEFAVTDTETQALLLEANLIKRHQPRYNVRLKDDKSYPLVQLTNHPIPRIEITRDPSDAATVFGPFTDKGRVETVVKAIRETYGLRGCSDHKYSGRDRPCLDYEMGLCTAPCTGEIDPESYREDVQAAVRFFEGETGVLADPLRREMETAAEGQAFERAANLRDRLKTVENFHGGGESAVSGHSRERAVDVLGVSVEGDQATVARLHSEDGQLVDRSRHTLDAPDDDARIPALLSAFIPQYYAEREFPDALLLSERPSDSEVTEWLEAEGVAVRVPGAGREATLVDLALKNARQGPVAGDPLGTLGDELGIGRPTRIEGFDVSHSQGKAVVGSNVCFVDGSAAKSDYRRKKLTDRNDDYANMYDLIEWRASRAVEGRDDRPDPDLLLIDGGEGQLGAALDALEATGWDVPAVALAKERELIVTPDRVFDWPNDADHLHVCQRVRDEAHRFAVQYHQTLRDEVATALDGISGVGPETRRRLLGRFGSVENVRNASEEDLKDVDGVGTKTAAAISQRL
ncbi:excinuclease ABC subunit C [Halohasta litchfieldiae]|jgi:excinuclease ABC subunit C|uniref:UvrABC system protein C n=1 Tax=Halohasta litchfieldiae TaxID=1073996 RepID=A0A1H6TJY0_9EURY|nr:excinuclease ABC subunit C [Halohasta litchfieldiae]ATW88800.1 excinuclease ABC subunit C [Halohasta litchfieldiae]SEI78484.1 Excinuclease ABC subunit C [Halohasta litchfieldiae]